MFSEQVECLRKLADQALRSPTGTESRYLSQEIATLLHNISGTAAYFDRAEFGTFAMHAEPRARAAFTADLLRPLCREILAELSIDDPD